MPNAKTDKHGPCPVCFNESDICWTISDSYKIECPKCGEFEISRTASVMFSNEEGRLKERKSQERANLSGWLRERRSRSMLCSNFLDDEYLEPLGVEFWSIKTPTVNEKAEKLLLFLAESSSYAGHTIECEPIILELEARSWAINYLELRFIAGMLYENKLINGNFNMVGDFRHKNSYYFSKINITPEGWSRVEKISNNTYSRQVFVAMWFDDSMKSVYENGFKKGIVDAGLRPLRIDGKEHVNKIDDEIIVEIKKSRFIVADFTEHRGGVYFEAGFAMGLGIPVIWTCCKKDFKKLHFDIRQYNTIIWEKEGLDELSHKLCNRIKSLL